MPIEPGCFVELKRQQKESVGAEDNSPRHYGDARVVVGQDPHQDPPYTFTFYTVVRVKCPVLCCQTSTVATQQTNARVRQPLPKALLFRCAEEDFRFLR